MKVTKDVGRQANLLEGRKWKWAHWTNKKFRNKKPPTTSQRNQMHIFRERKTVPEIFGVKSEKKRERDLPK